MAYVFLTTTLLSLLSPHSPLSPLSSPRLVNMAYDVLDNNGDGTVTLSDIEAAYDTTKHPDVCSGKRTKQDVLRELLDVFDVGGEKGKIIYINYSISVHQPTPTQDPIL
jgi:hypothetical protein